MITYFETKEVTWKIPPEEIKLFPDEVHVWGMDRRLQTRDWANATEFLSSAEIQRAERLLREENRYRFAFSRGGLRRLLGLYLNIPPERIPLASLPGGRLALSQDPKQDAVQFNLSHSGDWTLFAFRRNGRLGIDVEKHVPRSWEKIAARHFSKSEIALLENSPASEKPRVFWILWTLKEAKLKALGAGIAKGLKGRTGLQSFSEEWQLQVFSLPESAYTAALALSPPVAQLRFFRIAPSGLATAR